MYVLERASKRAQQHGVSTSFRYSMASPHELVLKYGKASAILSKRDADLVAQLCECGRAFVHLQTTSLVRKYMDEPIALSYASDGTPLTTTERFAIGRTAWRVHRRGGSMRE